MDKYRGIRFEQTINIGIGFLIMSKYVHTEHCCRNHGCKYYDSDCPVYLGYKAQSFPCEDCCDWVNEFYIAIGMKDVPKVSFEEFKRRRLNRRG